MANVWPSASSTQVSTLRSREAWHGVTVQIHRVCVIQFAHFRSHFQADPAVTEDDGNEVQTNPVVTVFDRRRDTAGAALWHWDRIFTTSQEAGSLPADRDEIRLGEDAEKIVLTKGVDEHVDRGPSDGQTTKQRGRAGGGAALQSGN